MAPGERIEKENFFLGASPIRHGEEYHSLFDIVSWYKGQFAQVDFGRVFYGPLDPKVHLYADAFKASLDSFGELRCPKATSEPKE